MGNSVSSVLSLFMMPMPRPIPQSELQRSCRMVDRGHDDDVSLSFFLLSVIPMLSLQDIVNLDSTCNGKMRQSIKYCMHQYVYQGHLRVSTNEMMIRWLLQREMGLANVKLPEDIDRKDHTSLLAILETAASISLCQC